MFATASSHSSQQYSVTPTSKRHRTKLPERAQVFFRDVKRRSLRVRRAKSVVISSQKEKRISAGERLGTRLWSRTTRHYQWGECHN